MLRAAGLLLLAAGLSAQERAPGPALFGEYCSIPYCHGPDGGEGRAPALGGRAWDEGALRRAIVEGVPDRSMPPFGERLSSDELDELVGFILSISTGTESSGAELRAGDAFSPSDVDAGRAVFFESGCAGCHRFGRGDGAGPDLSRAAEKRPFEILRDILQPGPDVSSGKPFVRIETHGGGSFRAVVEEDAEDFVRIHDLSTAPPVLRRVFRRDVSRIEPAQGSPMPAQDLGAKQILDLVFFIRSGGARKGVAPEVTFRPVDIWSDGTRLSGKLYHPAAPDASVRLPAIVMSHGWGGLAAHLDEAYAPYFAAEGFAVLTFDYRGWGESDGRLVDVDGAITEVREVVDPWDQTEDIVSALHFIEGEPIADPERIGYWGTSYSGGHALWVAASDSRVKAIVAQTPAMDSKGFVEAMPGGLAEAHRQEIRRARGEIPPAPVDAPPLGSLRGHPYVSRMASYSPLSRAGELEAPILVLDAGDEELFDIREHGAKVYGIVKDRIPAKYLVFPGIGHYDIYRGSRGEAIAMAIAWFREHLARK